MNNVGYTPWVSSVQRWVTPSGPGPSVNRFRPYRTRSPKYAMSMPTCTPPTANDALGRKWCRNPGVLAHGRLAGDASPACLAGHPVPPGVVEVGMEHMPKPDRHESIMTAALGRPARRPRASFLTGRLPIAHMPTVPASGGWTPVRVAGGADAVGGVQGPANE